MNHILYKKKSHSISFIFAILATACVSRPSYSQDISPNDLYFYEGNQKILLVLESGLVAEFGGGNQSSRNTKSPVQKVDQSAELVTSKGIVNLWKTNGKDGSIGVSKSLNSSGNIGYSPVFKTVKGSTLLALPGNIIVELETSMNQKQAEVFFGGKGLRIKQKLEIEGKNYYEIETEAGASSLNIANSLYGQPGVISSTPNWWREMVAK
ncbi:MAG: hypothetical protein SH817_02440 [Leptospira sp.]|nr:hypothetical protein [Leptospira sp.]